MSALYRFGFEGGYFPNGVEISGSYMMVRGRSGASSSAVSPVDSDGAIISVDSKEPSSEIFVTEHVKFGSYGMGSSVDLLSFGKVIIGYSLEESKFEYKVNGVLVYQSPMAAFPPSSFIPIGYHVATGPSGSIETIVDATVYTYTGSEIRNSSVEYPTKIYLGMGAVGSTVPQLVIDDIAINNSVSHSNSTGSYGGQNVGYPRFIRGIKTSLSATGSTFQWIPGDPFVSSNPVNIVNGNVDSYLVTRTYNKIAKFIPTAIDPQSIISFDGINVFVEGATVMEGNQVYLNTYFEDTSSVSINQSENTEISTLPMTTKYSAIEKDLGGQFTIDDFNSGSLVIVTRAYINQNYFGQGTMGNVVITGSVTVPTIGDFAFLDYENLVIISGSILTTDNPCKGLVIYVKENCAIEGTISMDGKGLFGSLSDEPIKVWRNTSSLFSFESASNSPSSWIDEMTRQPYIVDTSSWVGLNQFTAPETIGVFGGCGGGGSGGSSSYQIGPITGSLPGGRGGSSSLWGGGCGGGGAFAEMSGSDAYDYGVGPGMPISGGVDFSGGGGAKGGGVIYLFVGGNLIMGSQSKISATGSNGTEAGTGLAGKGGGGGAGGGSINVFYGTNFYNLGGSLDVRGGKGSNGASGGTKGVDGSSGSIRLLHLLSN